jgi:site-specific recombinase XerD
MEGLEKRLKEYRAYLTLQKGFLKSTRESYTRILSKMLRDIGTLDPTHDELNAFMLEVIDRAPSYTHITNTMRAIESYADCTGTPIAAFNRGRKPRPVIRDSLTEAEVTLILAACKNIREGAVIALLADSGIRCDELCNTKVCDLDLGENFMKVRGKFMKEGVSFIGGECSKILQEYLSKFRRGPDDYLFTSLRHNEQMSTWAIRKMVRTIVARSPVKKNVHPHTFRHSLASNMLDRGANPITIQEQLRHRHLSTTMLYVHSRKDRVQAEYQMCRPRYH